MVSKDMYRILKMIPPHPECILYSELKTKSGADCNTLHNQLCEANYNCDYINALVSIAIEESQLSLTPTGCAAVEEYELNKSNKSLVRWSLAVAIIAAVAGVSSAISSFITLYITLHC